MCVCVLCIPGDDFYYTFAHLHKYPTGDNADELSAVQRVLMRHVTSLHAVYNKYSVVGQASAVGEAKPNLLTRLAFHRLLKDLKLVQH